ncbi:transferrin-like [Plodia interpunctella]|uniref:transferrin-like n=1 Tax=Plodia interpunctella TaxID=58824 RepID=UPI002367429E|nr:transferrin-like [Plodia interpunctella]
MGLSGLFLCLLVIAAANAQTYRVCVPATDSVECQRLEIGGSEVSCVPVETRLDCALKLSRNEADFGSFSEEETLLISQMQPSEQQVIATVRSTDKIGVPYAFESVAIVPINHTGGVEGLRNGKYCHPGLDSDEVRWSPRVLKALEVSAALTDRCPGSGTERKTAEELEVETLSGFFSEACRPGPWSYNTTVDADLKRRFPNLCALCDNANCSSGYSVGNSINVAGVSNNNRHIQALDCLLNRGSVAYVAWQHVQEFFILRNPQNVNQFSALCPNGTLVPLTDELVALSTSPCAVVRQPWKTIVAAPSVATAIQNRISSWWLNGADSGAGWTSTLYQVLVGGASFRVVQESITSTSNYTNSIRPIDRVDTSTNCLPAVRWCTVSSAELRKCSWLASAAHILGIQPTISCEQRAGNFLCISEITTSRSDVFSVDSHYGYIARKNYRLSAVKLVQNARATASRVAAFVKETTAQSNVTRFENLRDKVACFPEYGGIAFVAFVRAAHERQVISASECDYARGAGELFRGACAPGATSDTHSLSDSDFNSTVLCSACRPTVSLGGNNFTCSWDYTNYYYGNNGSIACLADPATDVAFLETQNLPAQMAALNLNPSNYRALCRNNTLANSTGVVVDDGCLLAHVVDAEVLARRDDPANNAINTLFDSLDHFFGYNVGAAQQLINLHLYSPFDGTSDLLFKDTTIGLTEYSSEASNEQARNYVELFKHLEACTGSASPGPLPDYATKTVFSIATLVITTLIPRLF